MDLELRLCVSEGTLSELDLAHVGKCALGRQHRVPMPGAWVDPWSLTLVYKTSGKDLGLLDSKSST